MFIFTLFSVFLLIVVTECFEFVPNLPHIQYKNGSKVISLYSTENLNELNPRVVGGKIAKPHQFPFQVGLKALLDPEIGLTTWCGGALISRNYILTAGHCIRTYKFEKLENGFFNIDTTVLKWVHNIDVFIGAHDLTKSEEEKQQKFNLHVNDTILHPQYDGHEVLHDIALIKLPEPVVLNENVKLISLPPRSLTNLIGETVYSPGWGLTNGNTSAGSDVLLYTKTKVISNEEGQKMNMSIGVGQMCTNDSKGSSVCSGDSGGPNFIETNSGERILIGITSFTNNGECHSSPLGLTRVTDYLDWISSETGISIRD